jgi:hypothetical protein
MRSRIRDVPAGAGADFGIVHGLVGIGEAVDGRPRSVADAILAVAQMHGEKTGRMVARFAALPDETFVWTRQLDGAYRLGRIRGAWRYDASAAAYEVGIHHVRPTVWAPRRFGDDNVPAAVARTFARGGRNLQRTHDEEAERQTVHAWQQSLTGDDQAAAPH